MGVFKRNHGSSGAGHIGKLEYYEADQWVLVRQISKLYLTDDGAITMKDTSRNNHEGMFGVTDPKIRGGFREEHLDAINAQVFAGVVNEVKKYVATCKHLGGRRRLANPPETDNPLP